MEKVTGLTLELRNRRPRAKIAGGTLTDTSNIQYHAYVDQAPTSAGGIISGVNYLVGGDTTNISSSIGPTIVGSYRECLFRSGTKITWSPNVGFTTTGRIYVAYIDNPEVMVGYLGTLTDTAKLAYIKALTNHVNHPVYKEFTYNMPSIGTRRKRFDVNATGTQTVDTFDRSLQGAFVWVVAGAPGTTDVGAMSLTHQVTVYGLGGFT